MDGNCRSGSQGRPTKRQRRGRPPKFSSNYSWTCERCGSVLSSQVAVKYHETRSGCAVEAAGGSAAAEEARGSSSARPSRQAKAVASKTIRSINSSGKYEGGGHDPQTGYSSTEYEQDNEVDIDEDSHTALDNPIATGNGAQGLRRRKHKPMKTPISPVSGISWRSACPFIRTRIEEKRVSPLGLWGRQNSNYITLPSAPLRLKIEDDQNQLHPSEQRMKTGTTVEILPFSGTIFPRKDSFYPDIFCNIGGKMLCAAPLVVPRFSAYNVEETKGNGGECCLHIAIGMDMLTEASTLVTASELPFRSPHFHAFGKAYPGPNLLQLWRVSFSLNKGCNGGGGEVSLSYCLGHMGGRVLDVAWAPDFQPPPPHACSISEDEDQASGIPLGLLAAACGDGAVRVFLCPEPPLTGECGNQSGSELANSIKVLHKSPAAVITLQGGTLLTCVSWSPHEPLLLACGAIDGSVSLWRLQLNSNDEDNSLFTPVPLQILLDISRGVSKSVGTMTRAIAWSPYNRNVLSTAGQRTTGKMWNIREPFFPNSAVSDVFRIEDAYDVCWCPLGLERVFIAHVGGIKLVTMSGKHFSLIKSKEVEVMPDDVAWGVDAVRIGPRRLSLVVASLPDGTVRFFQIPATESPTKSSKRRWRLFSVIVHRIKLNRNPQGSELMDPPLTCHSSIATDEEWEDEEKEEGVVKSSDHTGVTVKRPLIPWAEVNTVVQLARLDRRMKFSSPPNIKQNSARIAVIVGGFSGLLRCFVADETIVKSF